MGDFSKIDLLPPVALFQKMRVLHDLVKIAIPRALLEPPSAPKSSPVCTLSAY